jgi:carbonic anhydrase
MKGDLSDNAIRLNVEAVVAELAASHPILAEHVAQGTLQVVGAVYSLKTGHVTWVYDNAP